MKKKYKIGKVKCRAEVCNWTAGFDGRIQQEGGRSYFCTKFYGTREEAEIALQQLLDDLGAVQVAEPWHWELNGRRVAQGVENPHIIFDHSGKDILGVAVYVATFATPLLAKEFLEKYTTKVYDEDERLEESK